MPLEASPAFAAFTRHRDEIGRLRTFKHIGDDNGFPVNFFTNHSAEPARLRMHGESKNRENRPLNEIRILNTDHFSVVGDAEEDFSAAGVQEGIEAFFGRIRPGLLEFDLRTFGSRYFHTIIHVYF